MRFGRRGASLAVTVVVIAVALVIGSSLIPVILSTANSTALGVTGSNATLLDLVPTIFILILVVGGAMELVSRVK